MSQNITIDACILAATAAAAIEVLEKEQARWNDVNPAHVFTEVCNSLTDVCDAVRAGELGMAATASEMALARAILLAATARAIAGGSPSGRKVH